MKTIKPKTKDGKPKQKYRIKELTPGRFQILPVPAVGEAAFKVHSEIKKITKELFQVGASLDSICGSYEVIFQHKDPEINKVRIAQVLKIWEERRSL
jgi:hypothetical protein